MAGAKAAFTASWMAGTERKLDRQVHHRRPAGHQLALDALVQPNVGTPEAIDRLLRVAHQEELPGHGTHAPPVALGGIGGGEQQQQLRLQGIGVLELVDEDVRPARLQAAAHVRVVAHQVARAQQQIDEVEAAGPRLQALVVLDQRPQVVAQERRQVGPRAAYEVVELQLRRLRDARGEPRARDRGRTWSPSNVQCRSRASVAQLGLEAVVVAARELLAASDVGDEAVDVVDGAVAVVAAVAAHRRRRADAGERLHQRVDGRVAVERSRAPRRREVAPLHQLPAGAAKTRARARLPARARVPAGAAPVARRGPARASWRSNQRSKTRANKRRATSSGATWNCGSTRASTGRSRSSSAQNAWMVPIRATSSWGSALLEPLALLDRSLVVVAVALDRGAQPELQLAGGGVGERDRDHARRAARRPLASASSMRFTSAVVLPVPAAASTTRVVPRS